MIRTVTLFNYRIVCCPVCATAQLSPQPARPGQALTYNAKRARGFWRAARSPARSIRLRSGRRTSAGGLRQWCEEATEERWLAASPTRCNSDTAIPAGPQVLVFFAAVFTNMKACGLSPPFVLLEHGIPPREGGK